MVFHSIIKPTNYIVHNTFSDFSAKLRQIMRRLFTQQRRYLLSPPMTAHLLVDPVVDSLVCPCIICSYRCSWDLHTIEWSLSDFKGLNIVCDVPNRMRLFDCITGTQREKWFGYNYCCLVLLYRYIIVGITIYLSIRIFCKPLILLWTLWLDFMPFRYKWVQQVN